MTDQPVSSMQLDQLKIEWVPYDTVRPNKYNPNKMTYQDRMLLRQSLLEDGWTQPIVTLLDGTIVDGEQRWTTSGMPLKPDDIQEVIDKMEKRRGQGHPESESILRRLHLSKERLEAAIAKGDEPRIAAITGNLIPITRIDLGDDAHKMIATIRHNRARGTHQIEAMAGITGDLVKLGLDVDDLEIRLGMDEEEIERFLEAADGEAKALEQIVTEYSPAWETVHISGLSEDEAFRRELNRSAEASRGAKEHQQDLARREAEIRQRQQDQIAAAEAEGKQLTQDEKDKIRKDIEAQIPKSEEPKPPQLRKLVMFVTPEEWADVERAIRSEEAATDLVKLCRWALELGWLPT